VDYPSSDDISWLCHITARLSPEGAIATATAPIE
jgi:hypothetical protein